MYILSEENASSSSHIEIFCRGCTDFLIVVPPTASMQREKSLTPEIRQAMGLPDEIHGVPVAEGYPETHAQAIDSEAGDVPPLPQWQG